VKTITSQISELQFQNFSTSSVTDGNVPPSNKVLSRWARDRNFVKLFREKPHVVRIKMAS